METVTLIADVLIDGVLRQAGETVTVSTAVKNHLAFSRRIEITSVQPAPDGGFSDPQIVEIIDRERPKVSTVTGHAAHGLTRDTAVIRQANGQWIAAPAGVKPTGAVLSVESSSAYTIASPSNDLLSSENPLPGASGVRRPLYWNATTGFLDADAADGIYVGEAINDGNYIFNPDLTGDVGSVDWASVTGKPATFPPDGHSHPLSQISDAGGAASRNVGTAANTVAAGDDARIRAYDFGFILSDPGVDLVTGSPIKYALALRPFTVTEFRVRFPAGDGPTGSAAIFDLRKNGATILTTNLNIADGSDSALTATFTASASFVAGDRLEVYCIQVGSTTPGQGCVAAVKTNQ